MALPSLHTIFGFSQNAYPWTYGMPYASWWYAIRHCFRSWNSKRYMAVDPCSRNSLVLLCFSPSSPTLKVKFIALVNWQYLVGWGKDPLEGCVCSELVSTEFMGPGIKGKAGEGAPLIITPSFPLAKILLVVRTTFCSPGLGSSFQREGCLHKETQQ